MKIPYNYVWFNGISLPDAWVDVYNSEWPCEDFRHKYLINCFHLIKKGI